MALFPDTLSETILMAINSLEAVEDDESYSIDMDYWQWYNKTEDTCNVCLAGAVLVDKVGIDREQTIDNLESLVENGLLEESDLNTLAALNEVRRGYIHSAVRMFYDPYTIDLNDIDLPDIVDITFYTWDKNRFKADLIVIASMMEKEGL